MNGDPIRFVLFDAVGTLIYPEPPVAQVYAELGQQFGSRLTAAQVKPRFAAALKRPTTDERLSEPGERARWRNIVQAVFDDLPLPNDSLFEALWQHFADPAHWRVFDDVAPAWEALEQSGRQIAIASNFDERLRGVCAALAPLDRCRHLFVSSQIGYAKPDRRFYRAIEQQLNAWPQQLLLVGDDRQCDYDGALAAGWQALLIDRDRPATSPATITSLRELVALLSPG